MGRFALSQILLDVAFFILPRAMAATTVAARTSIQVKEFGEHRAAGERIAIGMLSAIARFGVQLFERSMYRERMVPILVRGTVHALLRPGNDAVLGDSSA